MKGSYILVMQLKKDSKIKIGKLGELDFQKGYYCYVGSAVGKSMNIENRTKRHERLAREKEGNLQWHIDYFLTNPNVSLDGIIVFENGDECEISNILKRDVAETIRNFGSSDCKCEGHLHRFENMKDVLKAVESI
jgi:Uri superfamily endonuclease